MKTKTVRRLMAETPEHVKQEISDYADNLVKKNMSEIIYCMCGDDSFWDWDKEGNKCVTCGNEIYQKEDEIVLKSYIFIHPLTAKDFKVQCESLTEEGIVGGDSCYQCLVEGEVIAQFPQSYAMIKLNDTI